MNCFEELCSAVYGHELARLEELLRTGVDINLRDADGRTALMHAILAEDASPEMVALLIANGAEVDLADSGQGWTALHFAARDQRRELVKLLLAAGARVEPLDALGNTPLWRAVMNRSPDLELVRLLLAAGADPLRQNRSGIAPADVARDLGHTGLLALFAQGA